jgi:hypothetical protein
MSTRSRADPSELMDGSVHETGSARKKGGAKLGNMQLAAGGKNAVLTRPVPFVATDEKVSSIDAAYVHELIANDSPAPHYWSDQFQSDPRERCAKDRRVPVLPDRRPQIQPQVHSWSRIVKVQRAVRVSFELCPLSIRLLITSE